MANTRELSTVLILGGKWHLYGGHNGGTLHSDPSRLADTIANQFLRNIPVAAFKIFAKMTIHY